MPATLRFARHRSLRDRPGSFWKRPWKGGGRGFNRKRFYLRCTLALQIAMRPQSLKLALPSHCTWNRLRQALARFFLILYSALATRISRSSSLIGIHDVRTFMAFSKSESSRISRVASISAADVACKTSISALNLDAGVVAWDLSPNSMNTSQTRSCAGNGNE